MSLGTGLFLLLSLVTIATPVWSLGHGLDRSRLRSFAQPAPLLEVFQVNRPPLTPQELANSTSCTIALMSHVFGNSAGMPFQGKSRDRKLLSDEKGLIRLTAGRNGT